MKRNDSIPALVWVILGILVMIVSYQMSLGSLHTPGPGLMPFLLGALLSIVSFPILLGSLLRFKKTNLAAGQRGIWDRGEFKNVLIILISLLAYALLLEWLGFLLTAFFFLFTLFATFDSRRWALAFGGSLLTILITYVLFVVALRVELPPGLLRIW